MSVTVICIIMAALLCGWLMLHWLVLGVLSLGIGVISLSVGRWDLLLIPKLFAILAIFQIAFLIGAAARSWWEERASYKDATEHFSQTILDRERVLVVEDDPLTAALIAGEIEAASGHPVGPARSITEALRHIEEGSVEAAVLDMKLLDGAATQVALTLMDRGLPFVIMSARSLPSEILQRDPSIPVFQKPVKLSVAVRSLAQAIRYARQCRSVPREGR